MNNEYFSVCEYRVTTLKRGRENLVQATVEINVDGTCVTRSVFGVGPVHALDVALRDCLRDRFPEIDSLKLCDYRVSVVDSAEGTSAQVRVVIDASDGVEHWDVGCVSANIIDASFDALCSAWVLGIMRARNAALVGRPA